MYTFEYFGDNTQTWIRYDFRYASKEKALVDMAAWILQWSSTVFPVTGARLVRIEE
jgi:hypothetical protein